MLQKPQPVLVADRFPRLLTALLDLLADLRDEEWQQRVHGDWSVKDLAAHLLGDELNILSGKRDGYREQVGPLDTWNRLVEFINHRNAQWVEAMRRLSPRVIQELLLISGNQANAFFQSLDMHATGGPVDWAGPDPAPVWLDVAREFTERWHHQQHIRQAVNKPGAMEPYFLAPVLATFVFALPRTVQELSAPDGTALRLIITGEAGGVWTVLRESSRWELYSGSAGAVQALVEMPQEIAWQVFTRGISKETARQYAALSGDMTLAEEVLTATAIIV